MGIQSLVARLEGAIFNLSRERDNQTPKIQRLLTLLGEAQLYLARSLRARDVCSPVPWLSEQWLIKANDSSGEFFIAAALADLQGCGHRGGERTESVLPVRVHLAPENAVAAWLADDLYVPKIATLLPGVALVRMPGSPGYKG